MQASTVSVHQPSVTFGIAQPKKPKAEVPNTTLIKDSTPQTQSPPVKRKMIGSFVKGLFDPIRSVASFIFQNPAKAAMYIGASIFALGRLPILSLALSAAILGGGTFQFLSGMVGVGRSVLKGDNAKTNAACERMGRGTFNMSFSAPSALRHAKNLKATLDNLRTTAKEATWLQKAYLFSQQRATPLTPEEISKLPTTWSQWGTAFRQSFSSCFDPNHYHLPENSDLSKMSQTVADSSNQVQEFLKQHPKFPMAEKAAKLLQTLPITPEATTPLSTLVQDPQLVSYLATVLENEERVSQYTASLKDLKSWMEQAPTSVQTESGDSSAA
jgi:hypothetical protein